MFGIAELKDRVRKAEQKAAALEGHIERMQNEWRQTREQLVIQMDEVRRTLRPNETK